MQAWYLNSPFLIYLIIITCLDKSKSGAHVNYFFCQFIKWFTIQYYHLLLAPCILKFWAKQTRKQRCLKLKTPSFQRCHITQKERSLILVAKGLRSSRKHSLPGESWVDLPAVFFSNEATKIEKTICFQPQITKWHISKRISYTFASHAPEKARNTWLFTSNYTFYIWKQTLFDFWVSGHTLSVG